MRCPVQSDRIDTLKLAYFEQLKLGVRGNTATVEADMKRAGIVHPVGLSMLWEQEIVKRAAGIQASQFDLTPVLGLSMGAWERALDDIIAELRNAADIAAETGDGEVHTASVGDPLTPANGSDAIAAGPSPVSSHFQAAE